MNMNAILKWVKENQAVSAAIITVVLPGVFAAATTTLEIIQSYRLNVTFGQSAYAQAQAELWERNLMCIRQEKGVTVFPPNSAPAKVRVVACNEGRDILVIGTDEETKKPTFKWVSWDKSFSRFNFNLITEAEAATIEEAYYDENGNIVQKVVDEEGNCVIYIVNPYKGAVVRTQECQ